MFFEGCFQLGGRDPSGVEEEVAQLLAGEGGACGVALLLEGQGVVQVLLRDVALGDEDVSELLVELLLFLEGACQLLGIDLA
ncbi:hypothetical protein D3C72_2145150 [compost metagenome]